MSYHLLVTPIIAWCLLTFPSNLVATAPPIHRTVYQYGKADCDGLRDFLNDVTLSYVLSLDPNSAAAELNEWIKVGIDVFIP